MKQMVLIVEDEEDINHILAKYLQAAKFETKSFCNAVFLRLGSIMDKM